MEIFCSTLFLDGRWSRRKQIFDPVPILAFDFQNSNPLGYGNLFFDFDELLRGVLDRKVVTDYKWWNIVPKILGYLC